MHRVAVSMLLVAVVAGCSREPAPATDAAPAAAATSPAAKAGDAPPAPSAPGGTACMEAAKAGPQLQAQPGTPVAVAWSFYEMDAPDFRGGQVPDEDALATYAPHLTRALHAALQRALAERNKGATENPGEKPPYADGELFVSMFEGYTEVRPLTVATEGDNARVPVCFAYADASGRTEWTDTVVLRREDGSWRIDDVVYGGQWDFANTGTLRDMLPKEK
jgi:hypothetical protein